MLNILYISRMEIIMKKYIEIAKIYLKAQLVWRVDTLINMLFTITKILFAYLIWSVIFDGKDTVAGFTFHTMLSYYIISSFLSQIEMSSGISGEISHRIRNGTFSKYMVIPINTFRYFLSMEVGCVAFYLSFDFLAAIVWVFLFKIKFAFTSNAILIICAVVMILLGLFFMVQLNYFLGILTLKFEEISTFLMIKDNLVALITGTIIPLALFPDGFIQWLKIFPFYYVTYLPSMLLIGRCEGEAYLGLAILACWCIAFVIINKIIYERYRTRYDGVGI